MATGVSKQFSPSGICPNNTDQKPTSGRWAIRSASGFAFHPDINLCSQGRPDNSISLSSTRHSKRLVETGWIDLPFISSVKALAGFSELNRIPLEV
jgi:hypothetical protein